MVASYAMKGEDGYVRKQYDLLVKRGKMESFKKKLRKYLIVNDKFQSLDIFLTPVFQPECKME